MFCGHICIDICRDFFDRILCTGIILDIIGEYTEHIWMLFVKDNGNIVFDNTEFPESASSPVLLAVAVPEGTPAGILAVFVWLVRSASISADASAFTRELL